MQKPSLTIKPAILSAGILCLAASFTAQAAPITYGDVTLDAEYILGASSGPKQDGMTDPGTSAYPDPDGADYVMSKGNWYQGFGNIDGVYFSTYGWGGGYPYFGAAASGSGNFYVSTSTSFITQYTNTSDVAQDFILTLGVSEGELSIFGVGGAVADLLLRVRINGVDVALSQTTLTQYGLGLGDGSVITTGRSCTGSGLGVLADYMTCAADDGNIISAARDYTLDLGLIGAGESFTLEYDIIATVSGNLLSEPSFVYDCADDETGLVPINFHALVQCRPGEHITIWSGEATARSSDPIGATSWPSALSGRFVDPSGGSVPEPSSMALFGLAFAGLAAARRRRQTS